MKVYIQLDKTNSASYAITNNMEMFSNILSTIYHPVTEDSSPDILAWVSDLDQYGEDKAWLAYGSASEDAQGFVVVDRKEIIDMLKILDAEVITIVSVANTLGGFKKAIHNHINKGVNIK